MRIAKLYLTSQQFFHYMEKLFHNLRFFIYLKFMCQAKILGPNQYKIIVCSSSPH
jgi:hypothetical protein